MKPLNEWTPLLDGHERRRALALADAIVRDLSGDADNGHKGFDKLPWRNSAGHLGGGASGFALACAEHGVLTGDRRSIAAAERWASVVHDWLTTQVVDRTLYGGMSGALFVLELLSRRGLIEIDPLDDFDADLAAYAEKSPWHGHYDLLYGLVGLGTYFLSRPTTSTTAAGVASVVRHLANHAESSFGRGTYAWRSTPELLPKWRREMHPDGCFDLGMAHGSPGVIAFLALALERGLLPAQGADLLEGGIRWLTSLRQVRRDGRSRYPAEMRQDYTPILSRTAWCYGDLGVVMALFHASRACGDIDLEQVVLDDIAAIAQRPIELTDVCDAPLCHGATGIAHVLNRLFHATGDTTLADAARRWYGAIWKYIAPEQILGGVYHELKDPEAGTIRHTADPSFIDGASGVVLALLAACEPSAPEWDVLLLLSGGIHHPPFAGAPRGALL